MDPAADTGYVCEIDGTDNSTGSGGDVSIGLGEGDDGGTTVWIWTGDDDDTYDNDDTEHFELTISEDEAKKGPAQISITTEHGGEKAHLGSSVLYTIQVENEDGDAVSGDKSSGYSSKLGFVDGDGDSLAPYTITVGRGPPLTLASSLWRTATGDAPPTVAFHSR